MVAMDVAHERDEQRLGRGLAHGVLDGRVEISMRHLGELGRRLIEP